MQKVFLNVASAVLNIVIGIGLGLLVLELVLRLNPALAPKGIAPLAPLDPPLTVSSYDVRYSDGDSFAWSPELIKPLSPQEDHIEAHVDFETDEFGFPNHGPVPPNVDMVVVGRSYSMGAETTIAWPKRVSQLAGWKVLNLAQIGSGNDVKLNFLRDYGFEHHPHWIIVEVLPLMDVLDYQHADPLLIQQIPLFVVQGILHRLNFSKPVPSVPSAATTPLYPLTVYIDAQTFHVVFSVHELNALTIPISEVHSLNQWRLFTAELLSLVREAHEYSACVALLYAQSKTGAYLPLLKDSDGLNAVRETIGQAGQEPTLAALQANAEGMRKLIGDFAQQNTLLFIDPTGKMRTALAAGSDPFMEYDSHLNQLGHELVAQQVIDSLSRATCN